MQPLDHPDPPRTLDDRQAEALARVYDLLLDLLQRGKTEKKGAGSEGKNADEASLPTSRDNETGITRQG